MCMQAFLQVRGEEAPALGFIAHMDTAPAVAGKNVKPCRVVNYDGKNILLNEEKDIWLSTEDFPELLGLTGQDLIVRRNDDSRC